MDEVWAANRRRRLRAKILGYMGLVCYHTRSTPCDTCDEQMPEQLRPDLKDQFAHLEQALAENPYWPELPPGIRRKFT